MAAVTCGRRRGVVIVRVALHARQRRVHPCQWIVSVRRVVEIDGRPVRRVVARIAGGWERRGRMVRIRSPVPVRLVASVTRRRQR